jgi:hypothetical protein
MWESIAEWEGARLDRMEKPKKESNRLSWTLFGEPYSARILPDGRVVETRRAGKTFVAGYLKAGIRPRVWPSVAAWSADHRTRKDMTTPTTEEDETATGTFLCDTPLGIETRCCSSHKIIKVTLPKYSSYEMMQKGVNAVILNTVGAERSFNKVKRFYTQDLSSMLCEALPLEARPAFRAVMSSSTNEIILAPQYPQIRIDSPFIYNVRAQRWCPLYYDISLDRPMMFYDGQLQKIIAPSSLTKSGCVLTFRLPA